MSDFLNFKYDVAKLYYFHLCDASVKHIDFELWFSGVSLMMKLNFYLYCELRKEGSHHEFPGPDVRLDVEGGRESSPLLRGTPW